MKIVTWNLNSIRARLQHVVDWVQENEPDVLCLQETKVRNEEFPLEVFQEMGLNVYFHGQPAYNGVALITPHELEDVKHGFPEGDMDEQARVISATLKGVRIINVYAPQGESPESPKFQFKTRFYARLIQWLREDFNPEDKVLLCGDLNIAPEEIDVVDPVASAEKCMFLPEERQWFRDILDWGMEDSFRKFHKEAELYSWWDYRQFSFRRNKGLRIDHVLVTAPLLDTATEAGIDKTPRGLERPSDHTPVYTVFDIS